MKKASEIVYTANQGTCSVQTKSKESYNSNSKRFSDLASTIISELQEHFPYYETGERTLITWTEALAANDCTQQFHLQAAMAKMTAVQRSKPPSPGQFVAWYHESRRVALGVPTFEFTFNSLMAIYRAAKDKAQEMMLELSPVVYKVYRTVDIAFLRESCADQRAYKIEIQDAYKKVCEYVDKNGTDGLDCPSGLIEGPSAVKDYDPDPQATQREIMRHRPKNWKQTSEFRHGMDQLKAIKEMLSYCQERTIPPEEMGQIIASAAGLTSTVKRVYKERRSREIQESLESQG